MSHLTEVISLYFINLLFIEPYENDFLIVISFVDDIYIYVNK